MLNLLLEKWKLVVLSVIMTTFLFLPACDSVHDYQSDLGDPSLLRELYDKATQNIKSLQSKYDSVMRENTKLKERIAKLRVQKSDDVLLTEREAALDEREESLVVREEQVKKEREAIDNENSRVVDRSLEIGKKFGQLEKAEERISELSLELRDSKNQLKILSFVLVFLIFIMFLLLIFIFLDKYGVFRMAGERSAVSQRTLDVLNIPISSGESKSKEIGPSGDEDTKALPEK